MNKNFATKEQKHSHLIHILLPVGNPQKIGQRTIHPVMYFLGS